MKKNNSENLLARMDQTIDKLIKNAERLNELSVQVTPEEELITLQAEEEALMEKLQVLDQEYKKNLNSNEINYDSDLRNQVSAKLDRFVALNQQYIDNLKSTHGIIQFDPLIAPKSQS